MIDHLDNLLRQLFLSRVDELQDEAQVRFEPPNDAWRQSVANLTVNGQPANALNVYMVDLRENRNLRSNERARQLEGGVWTETPAPRRVDCHYLITAWSPATATPTVEPTLDEHALLYKALAAVVTTEPIVPRKVYFPDPLPPTFPAILADAELPTQIVPPEGFPKLAEFWGAMGTIHLWKPAAFLIVTLPVVLEKQVAGPMVTTRITEYRLEGKAETAEVWIQIGGHVATGAPPTPVPGAWVRIEDTLGTVLGTTTTNSEGRFTFGGLQVGSFTLRVRAPGFAETTRSIQVPSATGNYDVQLT